MRPSILASAVALAVASVSFNAAAQSPDRDAEIARLEALGATRVNVGQDDDQVSWTVLADPEGNEFCVLSSRDR